MSDEDDFGAIEATAKQWMQAWLDQDRATLERIVAADFRLTISTIPDVPFERANWIETAVGPYVATRYEWSEISFKRLSNDLVAMSSIGEFDATMAGVDRSGRYFLTDIWRRVDDGWQVCARYSSRPGETDESARRMADAARA